MVKKFIMKASIDAQGYLFIWRRYFTLWPSKCSSL